MTILKVNSNLKHNGEEFPKGKIFEAEQSEFQALINSGVIGVVDGATTVAEGQEIVKQQATEPAKPEDDKPSESSQDTWGPTKEPVVSAQDATASEKTAPAGDLSKPMADESKPVIPATPEEVQAKIDAEKAAGGQPVGEAGQITGDEL
jgi:hypothetical protein